MQTITVKNCNNCLFAEANFDDDNVLEYATCLHPLRDYKNYKSPKRCALKKEEINNKI